MAAFTLRSLVEHKESIKIESAATWRGENLLLGTTTGSLLLYSMNPSDPGSYAVQDMFNNLSKRPVVGLVARERPGLLLALADGMLHVQRFAGDFSTMATVQTMKQVTAFALTGLDRGDCLLAVGGRRSVTVHRWEASGEGGAFQQSAQVSIAETPGPLALGLPPLKSAVTQLTEAVGSTASSAGLLGAEAGAASGATGALIILWLGASDEDRELLVGTRRDYLRVSLAGQAPTVQSLFRSSRAGGVPAAVRLAPDEALLCQERLGYFVGIGGNPSRKYGLSFREPPLAVAYAPPYVLSVHGAGGAGGAGTLEARLMQTQSVVQTAQLPMGLAAGGPVVLVPLPASGGGREPRVAVAGASTVLEVKLTAVDAVQRVQVAAGRFDEALLLCEGLHGPPTPAQAARREQILQAKGLALLRRGSVAEGCAALAATQLTPLEVLSLYPKLLPSGVQPRAPHEPVLDAGAAPAAEPGVAPLHPESQTALVELYRGLRSYLETMRGRLAPDHGVAGGEPSERAVVDTALLKIILSVDQRAVAPFLAQVRPQAPARRWADPN